MRADLDPTVPVNVDFLSFLCWKNELLYISLYIGLSWIWHRDLAFFSSPSTPKCHNASLFVLEHLHRNPLKIWNLITILLSWKDLSLHKACEEVLAEWRSLAKHGHQSPSIRIGTHYLRKRRWTSALSCSNCCSLGSLCWTFLQNSRGNDTMGGGAVLDFGNPNWTHALNRYNYST